MRTSIIVLLVALLAIPAFADKKKKGGGDEEAPPPPPAENQKKKHKDRGAKDEAQPAPAPAPPGTTSGNLKPGQAVGVQKCLGSAQNVNIDVTSKDTYGVQHCRTALQKKWVEQGLCAKLGKGKKLDYSWQFADTTGQYSYTCP